MISSPVALAAAGYGFVLAERIPIEKFNIIADYMAAYKNLIQSSQKYALTSLKNLLQKQGQETSLVSIH